MKEGRFSKFYVGLIILLLDLVSKFFVQAYLPHYTWWFPYSGIGVFKNFLGIEFSIVHATNTGAAWGILADWQHELLYLRIGLVSALLIYSLFFNTRKSWGFPLAFIIAGALGNVIDFFLYGHVIDMIHFILWGYDYPVFNIADSAIFIGITWLFLLSWLEKPAHHKQHS